MLSKEATKKTPQSVARIGASAGLLVLFPLLIWMAGRAGLASLRTAYAAKSSVIASAGTAVNLSPGDPEAHFVRGALLEVNNDLPAAISEYKTATSLRPDDYVLWLSLARASELNGDSAGAIAAARRAVPLAPYYAQPHWQLGNLLVRAGRRGEGFKELRLAGASNPTFLPAIIDLAWQLSGGDVEFVKRSVEPQAPTAFKALAEYFKKRGEVGEAIAMFASAGSGDEVVRAREQYLNELIGAKKFKEAYQIWAIGRGSITTNPIALIADPGFEQESNLDEPGFGWRTDQKAPSLTLSLDSANPKDGHSSLRVGFNGASDPSAPIISQLILIEPKVHYQLRFSCRTEGIVSGGPPNVFVFDAHDNKVLGQSGALPQTTEGWRETAIDFTTGESTTAIQIALRRQPCPTTQCPIFGKLWLDAFALKKM